MQILIIDILYQIYIFKTCWTLKLQENQSQKSEQVVYNFWLIHVSQKNMLSVSVRLYLGAVLTFH